MAKLDMTIEVRTTGAQRWLRYVAGPVAALFGIEVAKRVALWGMQRLVVYRVGPRGKWRRFEPAVFGSIVGEVVRQGPPA